MNLPAKVVSDKPVYDNHNKVVAAIKSLRPMRGHGVQTMHSPFGVIRKVTQQPRSTGVGLTPFVVKDDLGASLKCRAWNGTDEGYDDVYIAKPLAIRNTNAADVQNGVTYTYTYSLSDADTSSKSGDIVTTTGVGDGSGSPNTIAHDVSSMHYLTRTVSGSDGTAETDTISPPYLFNCIIYAVRIVPEILDGNECRYLELSGREWAATT